MTTKHVKRSKPWHVSLWIVQILVAGMFLAVGLMKTATPLEELAKIMPLAADMPALTRLIGISEMAGGLGLLLPAALRIWPQLTLFAAAALAVVMLLAILYHVSRGEFSAIGTSAVLGTLSAMIVWGRLYKAPIHARSAQTHSIQNVN